MFIIYERPRDYPHHYVMRRWTIGAGALEADGYCIIAPTLEEIRSHVPVHCVRIDRAPQDEPQIVEAWL
jgi:hypothetical protein